MTETVDRPGEKKERADFNTDNLTYLEHALIGSGILFIPSHGKPATIGMFGAEDPLPQKFQEDPTGITRIVSSGRTHIDTVNRARSKEAKLASPFMPLLLFGEEALKRLTAANKRPVLFLGNADAKGVVHDVRVGFLNGDVLTDLTQEDLVGLNPSGKFEPIVGPLSRVEDRVYVYPVKYPKRK